MKGTMKLEAYLVVAGRGKRYAQGTTNSVIQHASSLVSDTVRDKKFAIASRANGELFYGRRGTYTHFAFQKVISELEGGAGCALYPCDAAAITNAILVFVQGGDHILMTRAAYESTQNSCNKILSKFNVETTYYNPLIGVDIVDLLYPETRVIFLELPSSITMEVRDVPEMVEAIRAVNPEIVTMIDNTWTTGVLFKALDYGVDIFIRAGTKYTIGHSDAMLGTAVSNARCWDHLHESSYLMGQTLDVDTAYSGSRGLRTLAVRLKQHQESNVHITRWLSARPKVARVNHPTLPECPGHEYFQHDFTGSSGLFSLALKKGLANGQMADFLNSSLLFHMAYSRGRFESLILADQSEELNSIRPTGEVDFSDILVRVHTGLEDIDDLTTDLEAGSARTA